MDTRIKNKLVLSALEQAIEKHPESRKGNPYDNAFMESFYRTLKRELVKGSDDDNPEQARLDIFKYIECYYNTKRMHFVLNYMSPLKYELNIPNSLNFVSSFS